MPAGNSGRGRARRREAQRAAVAAAGSAEVLHTGAVSFTAADPEPLRAALDRLHAAPDDLCCAVRPWEPPAPELIGRGEPWELSVMHGGDADGGGWYYLVVTVPEGPPMPERGIPYPAGCTVTRDDGEMVHLALDPTAPPSVAAAELATFLDRVMGAQVGHRFGVVVEQP